MAGGLCVPGVPRLGSTGVNCVPSLPRGFHEGAIGGDHRVALGAADTPLGQPLHGPVHEEESCVHGGEGEVGEAQPCHPLSNVLGNDCRPPVVLACEAERLPSPRAQEKVAGTVVSGQLLATFAGRSRRETLGVYPLEFWCIPLIA